MLIVNQDRDRVYRFNAVNETLYTEAVEHDGCIMGINLMLKGSMVGTFDSVAEAIKEINGILSCKDGIYEVTVY